MNIPEDLRYQKTHEWVRVDGDTATVGITDFAQDQLGDVVFVELPAVGRIVRAGESVAVVESVKTASDIYAPVGGEILEVNAALVDEPERVNAGPYEGGWLFRLRAEDLPESLLDHAGYAAVVEAQA